MTGGAALIVGLAVSVAVAPTTRPAETVPQAPLLRVVPYKSVGEVTLRMHIIGPAEGEGRPAVVLFFCGGWTGFNAQKYFPQAAYFASRGALCFNAEVRSVGKHGTTPAECVIDGKSAIRWVRAHADAYGVDRNRIAAFGGSAAGHVSACAALLEDFNDPSDDLKVSPKPDALLLACPALVGDLNAQRVKRLGGLERARALSPVLHVKPKAPPTLIMQGERDRTTPLSESEAFATAMKAAGNRCEIKVYEGAGHGFHNWFKGRGRHFPTTLRQMDAFLVSLGWLKGKDTVEAFRYVTPEAGASSTTRPATRY